MKKFLLVFAAIMAVSLAIAQPVPEGDSPKVNVTVEGENVVAQSPFLTYYNKLHSNTITWGWVKMSSDTTGSIYLYFKYSSYLAVGTYASFKTDKGMSSVPIIQTPSTSNPAGWAIAKIAKDSEAYSILTSSSEIKAFGFPGEMNLGKVTLLSGKKRKEAFNAFKSLCEYPMP